MIWAALLGAMLAAGCWLVARALVPPTRSLRVLADELVAPRLPAGGRTVTTSALRRRWVGLAARLGGRTSDRLAADLAVLGRTPVRHMLDKLGYGVLFLALACVPTVLFPALDVDAPTARVRDRCRAVRRRRLDVPRCRGAVPGPRHAPGLGREPLTVYVDIVGISLAGGAGVEDALMVAARAGSGPQFAQLDAALRAAQTRRQKLWHALDELGRRGDIRSLRELAAAVDLAAESGSRIRETLLAKANALRVRQLTEAEAEAQKASETMGVAPALMAIAAVVLIGYPALARFLSG